MNEQLISVVEGYENLQIVNRDLLAKNFMLENQLQLLKKEDVEHHNALKQSAEYNEQLKVELREKDITVEKIANATVRLKARLGKFEKELCKFIVEKITDNFSSTAQVSFILINTFPSIFTFKFFPFLSILFKLICAYQKENYFHFFLLFFSFD